MSEDRAEDRLVVDVCTLCHAALLISSVKNARSLLPHTAPR